MVVFLFAIVSMLIAALVAVVELLSRYRDDPFGIVFGSIYSWAYFLFNGVIGLIAFLLLWGLSEEVAIKSVESASPGTAGNVTVETNAQTGGNASQPGSEPPPPSDSSEADTLDGSGNESDKPSSPGAPTTPKAAKRRSDLIHLNQPKLIFVAQATNGETPSIETSPKETSSSEDSNPQAGGAEPTKSGAGASVTSQGLPQQQQQRLLYYALAAGFGGALILRSRIITVRAGDQNIAIGPSVIIDQFLFVLDRQIDRNRAIKRMEKVRDVMRDINFNVAEPHVVNMIVNGLQNMTAEEREDLKRQIEATAGNVKLKDDQEKAYVLGFLTLDIMGEPFLDSLFNENHCGRFRMIVPTEPADAAIGVNAATVRSLFADVTFAHARQRLTTVLQDAALNSARTKLTADVEKMAADNAKSDQEKAAWLAFQVIDAAGIDFLKEKFKDLPKSP